MPLTCPQLGTWPPTQACALTGNQTSDPSVLRLAHNPLSHTSQGNFLCAFLKLYFIAYAITVVLIFPLCPHPCSIYHSLRQCLHHCSRSWVMCISSLAAPFPILYFTSTWLFCNYLFVLNRLTSAPIPPYPPPTWQPSKCSLSMIVFVLVFLVCFFLNQLLICIFCHC